MTWKTNDIRSLVVDYTCKTCNDNSSHSKTLKIPANYIYCTLYSYLKFVYVSALHKSTLSSACSNHMVY